MTTLVGQAHVLVVEPSLDHLIAVVETLTGVGFHVTAAGTFAQARALLDAHMPSILVAAVRLGVYNGLHLVIRGTAINPNLASLVMSETADPVLQADAEAMGATFIVRPIPAKDLVAAVLRTAFGRDRSSGAIRPPFERRVEERRRAVQSYAPERRVGKRRRELLSIGTATART